MPCWENVQFADLGLVVIDEQHRFGVDQRDALRHKGSHPHVLVLTATPIPRTVAMTVFGDLDVSTIAVLPQGRSPIESHVVALADHPTWYPRVWSRVAEEVAAGRQAFVVTSAISPSVQEEGELELSDGDESDLEGTPPVPRASCGGNPSHVAGAPGICWPSGGGHSRPDARYREG